MRKCRCRIDKFSSVIKKNSTFYYQINNKHDMNFPYLIFNNHNDEQPIATFSKDYFDVIFIDIQKERKEKIKKLNEKF